MGKTDKLNKLKLFWIHHRWLILVLFLFYAPFLDIRMLRTTGDEKVYLAQALEMKASGHWFCQLLGGAPDYYKGPLHYLLLLGGLKVFGLTLWSALYMNLLFCGIGAVALAEIIRQAFPEKKEWPFWARTFFAFNVGVYGHFFASQMEVELAGIFSLALYLLWRKDSPKSEFLFWILAGLAGWLKSPLHSVLLGCSAILFWLLSGELGARLRSFRSWLYVVVGVGACAVGYAPAYFLDHENFIKFYIYRETFKPGNGGPWWQSLLSIITYYLIPWMGISLFSYFEFFVKLVKRQLTVKGMEEKERRLWILAFSNFIFTVGFFCYHGYHGENYTLPIISSVVILVVLFLKGTAGRLLQFRKIGLAVSSLVILVLAVGFQIVMHHFQFPKEVCPPWLLPLVWTVALTSVGLQLWESLSPRADGIGIRSALSNVGLMSLVGIVLAVLGETEVYSLKNVIRQDKAQGNKPSYIRYWNLNHLIWNEWGLMSFAIHEKVWPLLTEEDLIQSIQRGDLILARDTDRGKEIEELAKKRFPELKPKTYEWNRWKTHAEDGAGNSLLSKAWSQKDLSILWDHALILQFKNY